MACILGGLASVLDGILVLVQILVIASVIISWVGADPYNQIVQIVRTITEPLYRPFRPLSARLPGGLDWSPFIVILIVIFLQRAAVGWLRTQSASC